ncbi:hypothetical protein PVAP13_7KG352801 [Panicum virgatum]|uniref:Uncharacterized protein n=1 Tax=Panicum virgatum TaxID=38727 RepID=A0A8T0QS22_PANVG|nr:hypothetical protein PVAP13_7KG352801 [Panicum virgatum]
MILFCELNACYLREFPQLGLGICRNSVVSTCYWTRNLQNQRVSIEEGEGKAKDLAVMFIETSAKAGFNIKHALFRKIAAALPGMETLSSAKQEDMVAVNLRSGNENSSQSQVQAGGSSC